MYSGVIRKYEANRTRVVLPGRIIGGEISVVLRVRNFCTPNCMRGLTHSDYEGLISTTFSGLDHHSVPRMHEPPGLSAQCSIRVFGTLSLTANKDDDILFYTRIDRNRTSTAFYLV